MNEDVRKSQDVKKITTITMNKKMSVVTTLYNYVSPMYCSLCRFLPGTTLHAILEQNIKIRNSHYCCAHTLHTPLHSHACMHTLIKLHSCAHMYTLIKGVLNQGQSPQRTPLLLYLHAYMHLHTHAHTINITTATVFLRPPSAISQSQPPSSWNTCMPYYSKILKYAHTHTQQPLCTHFTLYTHMHTLIKGVLNQGQSPQCTPLLQAHLYIHTHAHTANIITPTVLVRHSLLA